MRVYLNGVLRSDYAFRDSGIRFVDETIKHPTLRVEFGAFDLFSYETSSYSQAVQGHFEFRCPPLQEEIPDFYGLANWQLDLDPPPFYVGMEAYTRARLAYYSVSTPFLGRTIFIYEGDPTHPHAGIFFITLDRTILPAPYGTIPVAPWRDVLPLIRGRVAEYISDLYGRIPAPQNPSKARSRFALMDDI